MASKRGLRFYFSVSENVIKDSRLSIPGIISSASNKVSNGEVDMAKVVVKKRVAKRNNYQNVPEKVQKEVGRYALINGIKTSIDRYSKIYLKYDLKFASENTQKSKY